MAKSLERIQARELRQSGVSVRQIAKMLHVSKSTASIWVRDIILTIEQLEKLRQQRIEGTEKGRLIGAMKQKNERLNRIKNSIKRGKIFFSKLTDRELFVAGIVLYWGEGTKKRREIAVCNSDPRLIQFMIYWLRKCFNVPVKRMRCYVGINEIHKHREELVKKYWAEISGIPLSQFTKTSFKKVQNKKIYTNFNSHYGTLTVKVARPAQIYYDILGFIDGLYSAIKAA